MIDRIVGKKVIGIKQSYKAIKKGSGVTLYVATDVENRLICNLLQLAKESSIDIIEVDTMKKLGKMCGIDVDAAAALLLS